VRVTDSTATAAWGGERPADPPRRQGCPCRAGRHGHGDGRRQIAGVAAVDARGEVAFLGVTGGDLGGCGGWGQRVFVGEHAGGRRRGEAVVGPPRTIAIARRSGVPAKSLSPRCVLAHPWRSLRFLPVSTVSGGPASRAASSSARFQRNYECVSVPLRWGAQLAAPRPASARLSRPHWSHPPRTAVSRGRESWGRRLEQSSAERWCTPSPAERCRRAGDGDW